MSNLPPIYYKQWTDKSFTISLRKNWEIENITDYEIYFVVRLNSSLGDTDDTRAVIDKKAVITDWSTWMATFNISRNDGKDIMPDDYIYEISYKKPVEDWDVVFSHYWYGDFIVQFLSNKNIDNS